MSNVAGFRQKMKENMKRSVKESQSSTNYSPSSFDTYYTVPEGKSIWMPKGDDKKPVPHYMDIIPFPVGKAFPDKTIKGIPPGDGDYWHVLDLFIHRNVGPNNSSVVCPKNSYRSEMSPTGDKENTPGCPICEHMVELQKQTNDRELKKEIWKEKKPMRRTMYCVNVCDGGEEEDKGVQIYEVAHFYLQEKLDGLSESTDRSEGEITYPDPDEGKTIYFKVQKSGSSDDLRLSYIDHRFVDRVDPTTKKPYIISDELLGQAVCLDSYLKLLSYKSLKDLYYSGLNIKADTKEEKEEERVSRKIREEDEEIRGSRRIKEEKTEEKAVVSGECPNNFEFGVDCNKNSECDDCEDEKYKLCSTENERVKEEKKTTGRRLRKEK